MLLILRLLIRNQRLEALLRVVGGGSDRFTKYVSYRYKYKFIVILNYAGWHCQANFLCQKARHTRTRKLYKVQKRDDEEEEAGKELSTYEIKDSSVNANPLEKLLFSGIIKTRCWCSSLKEMSFWGSKELD